MTSDNKMDLRRSALRALGLIIILLGTFLAAINAYSMMSISTQSQNLLFLGQIGFGIALEILGLGLIILGKK